MKIVLNDGNNGTEKEVGFDEAMRLLEKQYGSIDAQQIYDDLKSGKFSTASIGANLSLNSVDT